MTRKHSLVAFYDLELVVRDIISKCAEITVRKAVSKRILDENAIAEWAITIFKKMPWN